jgi:hypothetical protein
MGYENVFPHVGAQAVINLNGKQVYPLVTGTFGGVDFLHSVLGEATDHVTQVEVNQTEVDQLNAALSAAEGNGKRGGGNGDPASEASFLTDLLAKVPGTGSLIQEAVSLQAASNAQRVENEHTAGGQRGMDSYGGGYDNYGSTRAGPATGQAPQFAAPPKVDAAAAMAKIYPILSFRDKVVRQISAIVSKIPGLEKMIETITEKVTLFVMGLLAPFVKPIIASAANALKTGSGTVVDASSKQQYIVWTDPTSTDPTHSMLSKDHFSNILNQPAGEIAAEILQYVAPRIVYAWEHPEVPVHEVLDDVARVFHHPAARQEHVEIHRTMFDVVRKWIDKRADRGHGLNDILSSDSVKNGRNHQVPDVQSSFQGVQQIAGQHGLNIPGIGPGAGSHSATRGGVFDMLAEQRSRDGLTADPTAYSHPPPPASYDQSSASYPTAYQQGYEQPWQPQQAPGGYDPRYGGGQQQGGYGYDANQQQHGYGGGYQQY